MTPKLLDYAAAATLLNMKRGTLAAKVSRKEVPHIRLGPRHVVFDEAELAAWLDAKRVRAEAM